VVVSNIVGWGFLFRLPRKAYALLSIIHKKQQFDVDIYVFMTLGLDLNTLQTIIINYY